MKRRFFFLFSLYFLSVHCTWGQLCSGSASSYTPCAGWEALSQIGSLIPERIWEEEFCVIVDRKAFQRAISEWNRKREMRTAPSLALAFSHGYFLKHAFSGDPVGIVDRYEMFQFSPYWNYPGSMGELRALEKQQDQEDIP